MNKSKLFILIAFAFVLCFGISGCTKSAVSEKNLLSYVEQDNPMSSWLYSYYSSSDEIRYYDLKVDRRLTDKSTKSDQVWVSFSADSETDSADVEACMSFTLYNDGWRLDDIEILSTTYTPLTGPSHELVGSFLSGELQYDYYQFQREEVDLENGFAKLYYKAMNEYNYVDYGYELCLNWYYGGSYGPYWDYGEVEVIEETQDWRRIYGIWEGADHLLSTYSSVFAIGINSITSNSDFSEIEGAVAYYQIGVGNHSTDESQFVDKNFDFSVIAQHSSRGFKVDLSEGVGRLVFEFDRNDGVIHRGALDYRDILEQTEYLAYSIEHAFYDEFFDGNAEVENGNVYDIDA